MDQQEIATLVKTGQVIADGSAALGIWSAIATDSATAMAAAVVSVGAIVIPRCLDWYKSYRQAIRQQHALDIEADTQIISSQAVEIARLRAEIADLRRKLDRHSCPFSNDDGARCDPDKPPGDWLTREPQK
jgi:hypothetical protein